MHSCLTSCLRWLFDDLSEYAFKWIGIRVVIWIVSRTVVCFVIVIGVCIVVWLFLSIGILIASWHVMLIVVRGVIWTVSLIVMWIVGRSGIWVVLWLVNLNRYFTTAFLYYCFTSKLPGTRAATLGLSSSLRPHALVVL